MDLIQLHSQCVVKNSRAAIIGTYHSNGGHAFWAIALRQPLQENRITGWRCNQLLKLSFYKFNSFQHGNFFLYYIKF